MSTAPPVLKFEIAALLTRSAARLGKLSFGTKNVNTPSLIVTTSRLCVPHLTPDTFWRTLQPEDFFGLFFNIETLIEDKDNIISKTCPAITLSSFCGYGDQSVSIIGVNDPKYYQGLLSNKEDSSKNNNLVQMKNGLDWVSIYNISGVSTLNLRNDHTTSLIKPLLESMKPNFLLCPTDHYHIKSSRLKRIKKSTEVNKNYWNLCDGMTRNTGTFIIPSIALHSNSSEGEEKKELVKSEVTRRVDWVIKEIESSPSPPLVAIIKEEFDPEFLKSLPSNVAVYIRGSVSPQELFGLLSKGVDLFDTTFASDTATNGVALNIFEDGSTQLIPLDDSRYFTDFEPLNTGCNCIACNGPDKTTKSYLHHLLKTEEMLAFVFLSSHNLWQYSHYLHLLKKNLSSQVSIE